MNYPAGLDDREKLIWSMGFHAGADEIERLRGLIGQERIECAKIAEEFNGDGIEIADLIRRRPVVTY